MKINATLQKRDGSHKHNAEQIKPVQKKPKTMFCMVPYT